MTFLPGKYILNIYMANMYGGIILVSVGTYLLVLVELEDPTTWKAAHKQCEAKGQILSPLKYMALNEDIYIPRHTVWTSNVMLNLGCDHNNTDFCTGLFVEKVVDSDVYCSLCYDDTVAKKNPQSAKVEVHRRNTTFNNSCGGNSSSLIEIINMHNLKDAKESMFSETKYWIRSFHMNLQDSFVCRCQVFHMIDNKSPYETDCGGIYKFLCVPDTSYQTVISLIRLSTTDTTTVKDWEDWATQHHDVYQSRNFVINMVIYIVAVAVLILLLGICLFCNRRKTMQQSTFRVEQSAAITNQSESAEIN